MDPITEKTQNTGFNNQQYLLAALGYVWFIGVLIMVIKKNDSYVYQHSRNGTALFILSVLWFIWPLGVIVALFEVYGFYQAFIGRSYKLPIIGNWLETIKL